ncbi:SOS response-associated peptidase [Corynebacterium sp. ES2794-CONJ1]|uniref:SOS response-associated peptidase n=1 Tax=unclassified Corynebacterium TaxID=2624378 RepID=UPI00216B161D|nr:MULTISPECIES: SOS response-associated peptidase [unclassified Corynebacterium]MCS4531383.1 SOS response-associated peptidase [Corynebacterium sp. ES2730-CONJ]MCU9518770.1 SOS response-associated peptidase [Corynebacterium sp. ES2794-CONJ1]
MCGRYVLFAEAEELLDHGGVLNIQAPYGVPPARYNIAPTHIIPILAIGDAGVERRADSGLDVPKPQALSTLAGTAKASLLPARWGLIPPWQSTPSGPPLFNARAETVTQKPSFKAAFARRRCLIPMNGYYEWKHKEPFYIHATTLMWAAGIYETHHNCLSTTIITTQAIEPVAEIHHRMPLFIPRVNHMTWLQDSTNGEPCMSTSFLAEELLDNIDSSYYENLHIDRANPLVGHIKNEGPHLLENPGLF